MGGLGRKFLHKLPDMENLRNLESLFILWIQIDIYFLADTSYGARSESEGEITTTFSPSMTSALRASGAMALLSPWKVRRAGAVA